MIKLELSVREAMWILSKIESYDTIYDKIGAAFEQALAANNQNTSRNCTVTITNGMDLDNRIPCIKAIRQYTGWGLKESKGWTDDLVGGWKGDRFVAATHHTNSITLKHPNDATSLLRDLTSLGCEGFLS
jgi:ribosomal protein L7/L12